MRFVWLFLGMSACAPTMSGHLQDENGGIVTSDEARVNIVGVAGGEDADAPVVVVEVDGDGRFSTREELPPGDYLVEALVPGYALASKRVRLGQDEAIVLTLAKVGDTKTEAVRANADLDAARGGGGATLTPPSL